jgi:hypothetical protein
MHALERLFRMCVIRETSYEGMVSWWTGSRDANRRRQRILAVLLILICLAVAIVGVPMLQVFGHDLFVSLDGGWRVLHGQRPSVDFYSQMGPAYYLLHATGIWLAGGDARGLGYGSALATSLISFWAFFLLRSRMRSAPLFVACLFLALLVAAPFPIGDPFFEATFSMKHNRYGYALTALVLLESFLPQEENTRKKNFLGGFSSGVACALLLFLKISYGFVALAIAAVSLPFCVRARRRLAGMIAGFVAIGLPMMAYLRFDLPSQVFQYQMLARAQEHKLGPFMLLSALYHDREEIALVVLLAVFICMLPGISLRRSFTLMLIVAMAIAASTLLVLTNTQPFGMPLLGAATLLLMNELDVVISKGRAFPQAAPLLALGLLTVGIPMFFDAAGLAIALEHKLLPNPSSAHFHEARLASIAFADCSVQHEGNNCTPNDNGGNFVRYTEEGIALAQANSRPGESIQGMGMCNPFSFALQRPPSHGGAVNLSRTNISSSFIPPKKLLFGDVALLLVPKFADSEKNTQTAILHAYPELRGVDYHWVAESENWILYRRAN